MNDHAYMARALQLAAQGLYSTHPNPRVGCVIVKDGTIVGEGWHQLAGTAHAEVHALRAAGTQAQGATAYVSLEPCSHQGRTPPCADALIQAGVARVVIAMQDPNPQVAGQGLQRLTQAGTGVQVLTGALSQQAEQLNRGFVKRMRSGLPWVQVKLAMSLDGRTAMASGESQWITGAQARADVQRLRAQASAIISGANTVLTDNARLTVRANELDLPELEKHWALQRPPMRVLVDSRLRVPQEHVFFQAPQAWLASYQAPQQLATDAQWLHVPEQNGHIDLTQMLKILAQKHRINEVLVEAGPQLAGAFLQAGLVDELIVYIAAKLLGSQANPLFTLPLNKMAEAVELEIQDIRAIGADWRITCGIKST